MCFQITQLKIENNPFAKGFRGSEERDLHVPTLSRYVSIQSYETLVVQPPSRRFFCFVAGTPLQERISSHTEGRGSKERFISRQPFRKTSRSFTAARSSPVFLSTRDRTSFVDLGIQRCSATPLPSEQRSQPDVSLLQTQRCIFTVWLKQSEKTRRVKCNQIKNRSQ